MRLSTQPSKNLIAAGALAAALIGCSSVQKSPTSQGDTPQATRRVINPGTIPVIPEQCVADELLGGSGDSDFVISSDCPAKRPVVLAGTCVQTGVNVALCHAKSGDTIATANQKFNNGLKLSEAEIETIVDMNPGRIRASEAGSYPILKPGEGFCAYKINMVRERVRANLGAGYPVSCNMRTANN